MEYRQLGNTGLKVSAVGLGGNVFGPPRQDLPSSIATVHHALALGVNLIDTAHMYNDGHSEEFLGKALAGRRGDVVLASKCHLWNMAAGESVAARIRSHCETSLRRLDTDYLDLLQLHFAVPPLLLGTAFTILMLWSRPAAIPAWAVWAAIATQAVVWVSTVTIQVPIQLQLSDHGLSVDLVERLIETNFWLRRIPYAICAGLFLWMAAQVIGATGETMPNHRWKPTALRDNERRG